MKPKSILPRGFKANAERLAKDYRIKLDSHPGAPLCAFRLAEFLGVDVIKATEAPNAATFLDLLAGTNGRENEWSALTLKTKIGNTVILYNPYHSEARQQSDIMHELAHIIRKHEYPKASLDFVVPFGMRHYNELQEEEAKCLGATLQLTNVCLLWARKKKMSISEIASYFKASEDMVIYRLNMTGIAKRYAS